MTINFYIEEIFKEIKLQNNHVYSIIPVYRNSEQYDNAWEEIILSQDRWWEYLKLTYINENNFYLENIYKQNPYNLEIKEVKLKENIFEDNTFLSDVPTQFCITLTNKGKEPYYDFITCYLEGETQPSEIWGETTPTGYFNVRIGILPGESQTITLDYNPQITYHPIENPYGLKGDTYYKLEFKDQGGTEIPCPGNKFKLLETSNHIENHKGINYFLMESIAFVMPDNNITDVHVEPEEIFSDGISRKTYCKIDYVKGATNIYVHAFKTWMEKGNSNNVNSHIKTIDIENMNEIPDYAFHNCLGLEKLFIGEEIRSIGESAFGHCWNLKQIGFNGENLESIGDKAFWGCLSLLNLNFPISLKKIGNYSFSGGEKITYLNMCNIHEIGEGTFSDMYSLKEIKFSPFLKSLPDYSIANCGVNPLIIPSNIEFVGKGNFVGKTHDEESDLYWNMQDRVIFIHNPEVLREDIMDAFRYYDESYNIEYILPSAIIYVPDSVTLSYRKILPYEVYSIIESISSDDLEIFTGEELDLSNLIVPSTENFDKNFSGKVDDENIVELDLNQFTITGKIPGDTYLHLIPRQNYNLATTIKVKCISNEDYIYEIVLNLESAELNIGETVQLEATVLPEDTSDKSLTWNSTDPNVASVSDNGIVTAISTGSAIITATYGEISAECTITVLEDAGVESLLANPETKISIYSTDGILIKKDCKVEDLKTLKKGIYIIVSGKQNYKISI